MGLTRRGREEPNVTLVNEGLLQQNRNRGRGRCKRRKALKWGTINAHSLVNKMVVLDESLKEHGFKIVSVTKS